MRKQPASISRFSTPEVLAELAAHLEAHNVRSLEIKTADGQLEIVAAAGSARSADRSPATPTPARTETALAKAPAAGIFLPSHPSRPAVSTEVGKAVTQGEIVAFIKTGPVLLPVVAEKAGVVAAVAAEPGTLVGYGTPLFKAKA